MTNRKKILEKNATAKEVLEMVADRETKLQDLSQFSDEWKNMDADTYYLMKGYIGRLHPATSAPVDKC